MWENSTYKIYVRVESWSQKSSKYATCKGYVSIFLYWIQCISLNMNYLKLLLFYCFREAS